MTALQRPRDVARVLGRVGGEQPGPTLVAVGSLHGNEPAGIEAIQRIAARLGAELPLGHGDFLGLCGNRAALPHGRRYLAHDLNRHWTPARVATLTADGGAPGSPEDTELLELWREIDAARTRARGTVIVLDLHTTSGPSAPFATIGDTLTNRRLALALPIPIILGIEEQLDGTLLEFLSGLGYVTLGLEGGRHDDPASADHLEAGLWIVLHAAGLLGPGEPEPVRAARARLATAGAGLPRVVEVRHRHAVQAGDGFRMRPDYASFQAVSARERVADDRSGPVSAPEPGLILMPLYQPLGDDGFFIIREFRPFWLTVSAALRHLRADRIVHWLPGVHRDPARPDRLIVDRRVARWLALQVFHLLGFRKVRSDGARLLLSRRREPADGPSRFT